MSETPEKMNIPGKVLVTGGSGFIGSHLIDRLVGYGSSVTVIDDLSTGVLQNIKCHVDNGDVRFIHSTVSALKKLEDSVGDCDYVVHLAAAVGVELVVRSPIQTMQTNLRETEVILEAAAKRGVPVLMASTSEVYGKSQAAEFSESDDLLIGPPYLGRWSYACSKLMDEFMGLAYARERNLPVQIVRFFNTVGPRQTGQFGMVIPRFVASALRGDPIRVFGSGDQSRCFCHVYDTVEALTRLIARPISSHQIVNIGSTDEIKIIDVARLVCDVLNSPSPIELIPYDQAYDTGFQDMMRRRPSIEKLRQLTGFSPQRGLPSVIRDTAEFLQRFPGRV